jgi:hypothetical protein
MKDTLYQYAVKVILGEIQVGSKTTPIGPGIYYSSVNVHNPWRQDVNYAVKLAVSDYNGKPGNKSNFICFKLGPDETTEFDNVGFLSVYPGTPPSFFEGYCVIESEEQLDVVGVYTGAAVQDKHLGAMHMERVLPRVISICKDLLNMDISTGVMQWQLHQVPISGSTLVVGLAPISTPKCSSWTTPGIWVGTSGINKTGPGHYIYELKFCLCWTFHNAQINFKLGADNEATILINNNSPIPGPSSTPTNNAFTGTGTLVNITSGFQIGTNTLTVDVNNIGGTPSPSGMVLQGTLSALAADCGS